MAGLHRITVPEEGERVIFTAADGSRWRVADRSFGPPWARPYRYRTWPRLADPRATIRWFQGAEGRARVYRFNRSELRAVNVATLQRQLNAAEYAGLRLNGGGEQAVMDEAFRRMLAESRKKELESPRQRQTPPSWNA